MKFKPHVTLVGAGPGDPELLTIKAVKAIQAGSVLLVDDLVSDEITAYASPLARVIRVGKRGGCKSTPQIFIEKLMIQEALAGERVVRLKGGDPFIFGRGGEEVEHLQSQGIGVTIINGITAGLAGITSLGVPLTHRLHAQGVLFVTGHAKEGVEDAIDWCEIARVAAKAKLTIVIYMGVSEVENLERALLIGLNPDTPVALIQNVSLPIQRQALCTVKNLTHTLRSNELSSPCVIVVGNVLLGFLQLEQQKMHQLKMQPLKTKQLIY